MKPIKSKKNKHCKYRVRTAEIALKDGDVNTIVQWLVDTHLVEWYVTYLLKKSMDCEDVQDKIQDIYVMCLEIPQERWDEIYAQGQFSVSAYVTGIVHQQIISNDSITYRKYNKHHSKEKRMGDEFWKTYYNDGEKRKDY